MKIKILGSGCPSCIKLEENAKQAIKELGKKAEFEKVREIDRIISYGVTITPALVVDGEIVSAGKILSVEEIKKLIK